MSDSHKRSKTCTRLFLIGIYILLPNYVSSFQNEPDNFRGIKWNTDISTLSDLVLKDDSGGINYYEKENDKMNIGPADVKKIGYGFYKDKFYTVMIMFDGDSNFGNIKETLSHTYGDGVQQNQFMEEYKWFGKFVYIYLHYKEISRKGSLSYYYIPILKQRRAIELEKARKGNDDL
jgi:hypothetical protein